MSSAHLLGSRLLRGLRLRLAMFLDVAEHLLQRFDQTRRVGPEPLMSETHCVTPHQRPHDFRKLLRARHLGVAD